jgi:hypothetical protein
VHGETIKLRAALASTFRALFLFEWIPSTVVFLAFNLFGQLCYYQSTNLVVVPPKLPTPLLAIASWVLTLLHANASFLSFSILP